MKAQLQKAYLDWVNNYLTIAKFSEDYGLTEQQGQQLIELGRSVHEMIVSQRHK